MQPYLLNPAQQIVLDCGVLTSGFSTILQMPTGSGKTWLAKLAIRHGIENGLRAIYLTPLRALAAELVEQWTKDFNGIKVGIFTGDYGRGAQNFPTPYQDAQLLDNDPRTLGHLYQILAITLGLDSGGRSSRCR